VAFDRRGGKTLGIKLLKGDNGKGASVKSVDAGGQAENYPGIVKGLVITHINGAYISDMDMNEIGGIVKSQDTCKVTMAGYAQSAAKHGEGGTASTDLELQTPMVAEADVDETAKAAEPVEAAKAAEPVEAARAAKVVDGREKQADGNKDEANIGAARFVSAPRDGGVPREATAQKAMNRLSLMHISNASAVNTRIRLAAKAEHRHVLSSDKLSQHKTPVPPTAAAENTALGTPGLRKTGNFRRLLGDRPPSPTADTSHDDENGFPAVNLRKAAKVSATQGSENGMPRFELRKTGRFDEVTGDLVVTKAKDASRPEHPPLQRRVSLLDSSNTRSSPRPELLDFSTKLRMWQI